MKKSSTKTGFLINPYFALVSGVLAVCTGAIFVRFADAPALVIAAYRVGLATVAIAPAAIWEARVYLLKLSKVDCLCAVLSGLFLSLHFAAWISSLNYTSVANSVVLVNTNPLWVGLLSPVITGDRLKPLILVSIMISIAGATIIGIGDINIGKEAFFGDVLALLGGICASIYLMLGRNLRRKLSLLSYIFICYGSAAVILWGSAIALNMKIWGFDSQTLAALWASALIPQLIGHTSYNWALKWFSASIIAISLLGEPVGSSFLAYLLFDEALTVQKIAGGALILIAIYLSASSEKSPSEFQT